MKDNSTAQLLPCPFCGGRAERHDGQGRMHTIACSKCHALSDYSGKAGKLWNTRAPVSQDAAQLVERLRRQARTRSDIQRTIAQAKSLRQEDHDPPRDDLYMWSAPAQTIEWQAADLIEALTRPQPSTSSVEAVARALAADIMAAMRRARLPKEYADEAHDEFEALTLVPMLLAALPSPEREPMREALTDIVIYSAPDTYAAGRAQAGLGITDEEVRNLKREALAQSGDRT